MVVRQTSKTVYLAVVILQETELGINKSGTFVHLRLCKKMGKTKPDICHKFILKWQTCIVFYNVWSLLKDYPKQKLNQMKSYNNYFQAL